MTEDVDARLRHLMEQGAAEGYLLGHRFPPAAADAAATSYFGGAPRLPAGLDWPTATDGRALHFLAQIDLQGLDARRDGPPLPASGTLFFFASVADDTRDRSTAASWAAVRFIPGSTAGLPMRAPPPGLAPVQDGLGAPRLSWLREDDPFGSDEPTTYPFWPMTRHPVRSLPSGLAALELYSEEARRYEVLYRAAQAEAFTAVLGPPATYAPPDWWRPGGRFDPAPIRPPDPAEVWLPDDSWPYAWVHVRIVAATMLRALDDAGRALDLAVGRQRLDAAAAAVARLDQAAARQTAEAWYGRGRRGGLAEAVPAAERSAFRAWLRAAAQPGAQDDGLDRALRPLATMRLNDWTARALEQGTDVCIGYAPPGGPPACLPAPVLGVLAPAHAPFHRDTYGQTRLTCHQLLGAPRSIQHAAESLGPTHRLLAQFDHDPAMLFLFGDLGAVQFWITPQDLAAGRFESCVVTFESH